MRDADRAHGGACWRETRAAGGRLFILGVGGSAANASHAVNDFRKIAGMEAYAPTDNVSELTARTNDDGWPRVFEDWLRVSRCRAGDAVLVLSRGRRRPGTERQPEPGAGAPVCAQRGRHGAGDRGPRRRLHGPVADACVIVPTVNPAHVTPHTEAFQAVVWHLLVSHPALKQARDEMGERAVSRRAVFLDRDGVLNRAVDSRRQAVSARVRGGIGDRCRTRAECLPS